MIARGRGRVCVRACGRVRARARVYACACACMRVRVRLWRPVDVAQPLGVAAADADDGRRDHREA
eukprot:6207485-Pleurochrysis_carterae.AAC.1